MVEEYKSNSHKFKKEQSEKKVEKIVTGTVKHKKKNEVQKFTDVFIAEDVGDVKSYILLDILVPAVKKAVSDIVTNGIDMILYGGSGKNKNNTTASKISYRNFYDKSDDSRNQNRFKERNSYPIDTFILDNRGEAESILSSMDELVETYGVVSVADLYDLIGVTGKYTDNNYGWTDIRNASVLRVRNGYMLKLPKIIPLK